MLASLAHRCAIRRNDVAWRVRVLGALTAACLAGAAAAQSCGELSWEHVSGPMAGVRSAAAYDAARRHALLYQRGRLFAWDGGAWVLIATAGPTRDMVAAYDDHRGVAVLFGGHPAADTWEWDGFGWTRAADTGPSPRTDSAMAYDPQRRRVVLFGGYSLGAQRDTWEWDGAQWEQVGTAGPPLGRNGHAIAYDPIRQRIVMFGGSAGQLGYLRDTWERDGTTWTGPISVTSPSAAHAMAFDAGRGRVVMYGGYANSVVNSYTREWTGSAWPLVPGTEPGRRARHSMVYDHVGGTLLLTGGDDASPSDTWVLRAGGWIRLSNDNPAFEERAAMVYDTARERVVLFGWPAGGGVLGTTWERRAGVWHRVADAGPPARRNHAMAFDDARGVTVVLGGRGSGGVNLGDTWLWDGESWREPTGPGITPRSSSAAAFDSARRRVVVFGGYNNAMLADTWEWDGEAWRMIDAEGPSPRWGHALAYDPDAGRVVLFGGSTGETGIPALDDTWSWDGKAWTRHDAPGPSARALAGMAFDAQRRRIVLIGGQDQYGHAHADAWEWDGKAWTPLELPSNPFVRLRGYAMVYDRAENRILTFGGPFTRNETWALGTGDGPRIRRHPESVTACPSQVVALRVLAVGGPARLAYQWRRDGIDLAGANSPVLLLDAALPDAEGRYDVIVSTACGSAASDAAVVSVCRVDVDCSGAVTSDDFFEYVRLFFGGDARADFDGSGVVSSADFHAFLAAWFAGC